MSFAPCSTMELQRRNTRLIGSGAVAGELEKNWFQPASEKLREIAQNRLIYAIRRLQERPHNWDGYGSEPAKHDSVSDALSFVIEVADHIKADWINPVVGLSEDGNVTFEWWNGNKKLTLYIRPGEIDYVASWGPNIETQMESGLLDAAQFLPKWRWLWTHSL